MNRNKNKEQIKTHTQTIVIFFARRSDFPSGQSVYNLTSRNISSINGDDSGWFSFAIHSQWYSWCVCLCICMYIYNNDERFRCMPCAVIVYSFFIAHFGFLTSILNTSKQHPAPSAPNYCSTLLLEY